MEHLNRDTGKVEVPKPPSVMTASLLWSYLLEMADWHEIENNPVLINGEPIVNAKVVDNKVVLMTAADMLAADPPCENHIPVTHRDAKPAWCEQCGLTADWKEPVSFLGVRRG